MSIDLVSFRGDPPFDAQYVGTYQPLLGWVGRGGVRHVEDDVAALTAAVIAGLDAKAQELIGWKPSKGDRRPTPGDPVPYFWVQPATRAGGWARPVLDRARITQKEAELWVARLREGGERTTPKSTRGISPQMSNYGVRTRLALEMLMVNPSFQRHLVASLQEGSRKTSDLLGWIEELDFRDRPGAELVVSPVGLLNLYREYYFDFGTRLSPPIEHIWVAPGSDVEIIEEYSRTDYTLLETERATEVIETTEETKSEAETFSEETERQQQRDIGMGVSAEGGVNFPVWHASTSASFNYADSLQESKRQAREKTREVSQKIARTMRTQSRTLTRSTTEIRRANTRRHRISNPTSEMRNFEMRRKLQQVGVQVQHLGTVLCWQSYVSRPGNLLDLPELVHIGASEDFLNTPPPDTASVAMPARIQEDRLPIAFVPVKTAQNDDQASDRDLNYVMVRGTYDVNGQMLRVATDNGTEAPDNSDDVILAEFSFQRYPEFTGYTLAGVNYKSVMGTDLGRPQPPTPWVVHATWEPSGAIKVYLDQVNFCDHGEVLMTVDLVWAPPTGEPAGASQQAGQRTAEMQRKARKAIVDGMRERVELASGVRHRPSDELRVEERSVIYRNLMQDLVGTAADRQLQVISEVIKAIFDVEKMLYFVAPDWWSPRRHHASLRAPSVNVDGEALTLTGADLTRNVQDGQGLRPGYFITESSAAAPLGSSLGWLVQLDGDERRNAFLNSPWVQAVLPVRPGREQAAIDFLSQDHVEGRAGLRDEFVDEEGRPTGEAVEDRLRDLAQHIRREQTPDRIYEAGQTVYENGFRPFEGEVQVGGEPLGVFAEWVEIVPTKQIVPVAYSPPAPFRNVGAPPEVGSPAGGVGDQGRM